MTENKILVLGSTGMLGSMVWSYLSKNHSLNVTGTVRDEKYLSEMKIHFDAKDFLFEESNKQEIKNFNYVINCIGIIKPHCKDHDPAGVRNAIEINSLFPHKLAAFAKENQIKVIQIATDCVYSGKKGIYNEDDAHDALDVYGKSKSLGEVFDGSLLNIRCSIIGHEIKGNYSLLEWFLGNEDGAELKGFAHHEWNGVTTLQFAKLCETIIEKDLYKELLSVSPVHHYIPNSTVNKFELLNIFAKVYERNYKIEKVDDIGPPVKRTLSSRFDLLEKNFPKLSMEAAVEDLRKFQI